MMGVMAITIAEGEGRQRSKAKGMGRERRFSIYALPSMQIKII